MFRGPFAPVRAEVDIMDCEVEGTLPSDLNGTFYRVGPDFQYPPRLPNIPLDGEGHIGMFRFRERTRRLQEPLRAHAALQGAGAQRANHCTAPIAIRAVTTRASRA